MMAKIEPKQEKHCFQCNMCENDVMNSSARPNLISFPDHTLFDAENCDLEEFDTTPFCIGFLAMGDQGTR